jgi:hypothetical protein
MQVRLTGVDGAVKKLSEIPKSMHKRLIDALNRSGADMVRHLAGRKLDGEVLNRRTGTLARSITSVIDDQVNKITLTVGSNVKYLRYWERGVKGDFAVRTHQRTRSGEWKRWRKAKRKGIETDLSMVTVREHIVRINQAPRPVLQPTLDLYQGTIASRLEAATMGVKTNA